MLARLRIAVIAFGVVLCGIASATAGASPWNRPHLVTGAQAQDPSESGTDGLREDEPDAGRPGEGNDYRGGGAEGEALPPEEDFGCPIGDQDSFEMII